ncbi:MAG: hypothetical protein IPF60_12855 [Betaproteobacteria bacterium]|nr:hypothetical protein [Betaproteobacteria bacterium]
MWSEDSCGLRHTSFGARLFWDWQWSEARYPELPGKIRELKERASASSSTTTRTCALTARCSGEAAENDVLAKNPDG